MAYDLIHSRGAFAIEPGLGSEVGTKEASLAFSPAQGRLVEAHASGRPWFQARRDTRVLANLNSMWRWMRNGRRALFPWPLGPQGVENQPLVGAGSYLASAMQIPEGSCAQYGAKKRETDWGLSETCVIPQGSVEVLEDSPWLRAQGFAPVAAIDSTGGFVMGYVWAGDLVAVKGQPPFARGYRETMGPVPMPVVPPARLLVPRPLPPVRPPVLPEPDVDATVVVAPKQDSIWGWLALGGLIAGGLYIGSKAGKAKKAGPAKTENRSRRRRRNTASKRRDGWHWIDKSTAVHVQKGVPVEVQVFSRDEHGLDSAMAKAIGWWGRALREVGLRRLVQKRPSPLQGVKVQEA